jgi:hypothetical protein
MPRTANGTRRLDPDAGADPAGIVHDLEAAATEHRSGLRLAWHGIPGEQQREERQIERRQREHRSLRLHLWFLRADAARPSRRYP